MRKQKSAINNIAISVGGGASGLVPLRLQSSARPLHALLSFSSLRSCLGWRPPVIWWMLWPLQCAPSVYYVVHRFRKQWHLCALVGVYCGRLAVWWGSWSGNCAARAISFFMYIYIYIYIYINIHICILNVYNYVYISCISIHICQKLNYSPNVLIWVGRYWK